MHALSVHRVPQSLQIAINQAWYSAGGCCRECKSRHRDAAAANGPLSIDNKGRASSGAHVEDMQAYAQQLIAL